jgi:hypothetical protein
MKVAFEKLSNIDRSDLSIPRKGGSFSFRYEPGKTAEATHWTAMMAKAVGISATASRTSDLSAQRASPSARRSRGFARGRQLEWPTHLLHAPPGHTLGQARGALGPGGFPCQGPLFLFPLPHQRGQHLPKPQDRQQYGKRRSEPPREDQPWRLRFP